MPEATKPEAGDKPAETSKAKSGGYLVRLDYNPTAHIGGVASEGDAVEAYKAWFGITASEKPIRAEKSDGTAGVKPGHCLTVKDGCVCCGDIKVKLG